jgi:AcrR family transcriptional regulator
VTTAAVSELSGAPTGTLYHRFGSRANMVAELWIRTIRRLQESVAAAADAAAPGTERAVTIALATVDFCADSKEDARLLTLASREKLRRTEGLSLENQRALEQLNDPVMRQIHRIVVELPAQGVEPEELRDRVTFAAISVPYVAVRQALNSGGDLHRMRSMVEAAVRAVLADRPTEPGTRPPRPE